MQTIGNSQFDDRNTDYNAVYVTPPQANGPEPRTTVSIKTATIGSSGSRVPAIADYANVHDPLALQEDAQSSNLYLAAACGNCARAYGNKLTCALLDLVVDSLSACDQFASPFNISTDI